MRFARKTKKRCYRHPLQRGRRWTVARASFHRRPSANVPRAQAVQGSLLNSTRKRRSRMTTNWSKRVIGGFNDVPPAPLASGRHLRRFFYISIGIAVGMFLQARGTSPTPIASRVPLYCIHVGVELVLVWLVAISIRARGYRLLEVVGRRCDTLLEGMTDILAAA